MGISNKSKIKKNPDVPSAVDILLSHEEYVKRTGENPSDLSGKIVDGPLAQGSKSRYWLEIELLIQLGQIAGISSEESLATLANLRIPAKLNTHRNEASAKKTTTEAFDEARFDLNKLNIILAHALSFHMADKKYPATKDGSNEAPEGTNWSENKAYVKTHTDNTIAALLEITKIRNLYKKAARTLFNSANEYKPTPNISDQLPAPEDVIPLIWPDPAKTPNLEKTGHSSAENAPPRPDSSVDTSDLAKPINPAPAAEGQGEPSP